VKSRRAKCIKNFLISLSVPRGEEEDEEEGN
jgi:hypothetical protein